MYTRRMEQQATVKSVGRRIDGLQDARKEQIFVFYDHGFYYLELMKNLTETSMLVFETVKDFERRTKIHGEFMFRD